MFFIRTQTSQPSWRRHEGDNHTTWKRCSNPQEKRFNQYLKGSLHPVNNWRWNAQHGVLHIFLLLENPFFLVEFMFLLLKLPLHPLLLVTSHYIPNISHKYRIVAWTPINWLVVSHSKSTILSPWYPHLISVYRMYTYFHFNVHIIPLIPII